MKKLRIGVLLQKNHCPKWQAQILRRIEDDKNLSIQLIAFNGELNAQADKQNPNNSFLFKIIRPIRIAFSLINPLAYGLPNVYHRFDEKYNRVENDLWSPTDIGSFDEATQLTINPIRKGFSHYFSDKDLSSIKSLKLDVIIRFGFSIVRGDIHNTAKYGIWSFHHGDNRLYRGGPPGIWELIKGKESISVTLQQLNDVLDCGKTIARSTHRCSPYSAYINKNIIYSACGDLLIQKLRQTYHVGFQSIQNNATFNEHIPKTAILKSPRNFEFLPLLFFCLKKFINFRWPRNKKIQWYLATKQKDNSLESFKHFQLIMPPKDRLYADPFIVSFEKKQFVFIEELIYAKGDAHISVGELKNGKLINIQPIIEENFHLSYPFVFQDNGSWYLIPETRKDKSVRLYECTEFPYKWTFKKKLFDDVEFLDSTIHKQDDTYFLFANEYNAKRNTSNESLVAYYSKSLFEGWTPHPLNPLATNICNSRPAGKLFSDNNKLIMPTQNCALRYGHSTNFNEIKVTETHFSMKKISELSPKWKRNNLGSHTWNEDNNLIITDGHHHIKR